MKATFITDCAVEVVENFHEEEDHAEITEEHFCIGDEIEFDIFGHPMKLDDKNKLVEDLDKIHIQFGDGSVAFGLSRNCLIF